MSAVLLTADLMTASKVEGAAARVNCTLLSAGNSDAFLDKASGGGVRLVVLDLSTPGIDPAALVLELRGLPTSPAIVAFGPHVHEALLERAKEAGCDEVLARGQFHAQAERIFRRFA